ncbi:hypothetical protein [Streptomyces sp. NPDC029674]|uniref:hypothetical protein n=1 Tax=Streptomyces sp. NPDC029674 TaxID=3365297 RepID=UPI00384E2F20
MKNFVILMVIGLAILALEAWIGQHVDSGFGTLVLKLVAGGVILMLVGAAVGIAHEASKPPRTPPPKYGAPHSTSLTINHLH